MNRALVTICVLVLSAGLLSACGDEDETANNEATTQEEVTTETATAEGTDAAGDEVDVEETDVEMSEPDDSAAAAPESADDTESSSDAMAENETAPEPMDAAGEDSEADTEAAAEDAAADSGEDKAASGGEGGDRTPIEAVEATEKGELKSPYADDYESVAEEGHKIYMGLSCNGCHGGGGGGGMCPPLTNDVWVYGPDDDTLFRLVTVGSDGLQKDFGMSRKGSENVVGPMPPMGSAIKSEDDLWKIIAWIRKINPSSAGKGASGPPPPDFD